MAVASASRVFRLGVIQLAVGYDKADNVRRALECIESAVKKGCKVVVLPECFNSPYGCEYFEEYSELLPLGETTLALSTAAKEHGIYLIGGSIPERRLGCGKDSFFNTCTVWGPRGTLLAMHRKMHLFDVNIPGGITFKESDVMTPGVEFSSFSTGMCKIGLGICYDLRFEEMARIYRMQGCDMIVYPGAFNMKSGPMHWELLLRARAVDNQVFVVGAAPAHVEGSTYLSYGHSKIVDPWGHVMASAEFHQTLICADIDLKVCDEIRKQIPVFDQRRTDLYKTIVTNN